MSKQIKRFGPYAGALVVAFILVLSPLAWTDPPGGGDPPAPNDPAVHRADAGMAVREAMAFGPGEVLPAVAGDASPRLIIQRAIQFADNQQAQVAERVNRQRAATAELVERITWNQPATDAYREFHAARDALGDIGQNILADLQATICHLLGINSRKRIYATDDRPIGIIERRGAAPVTELLAQALAAGPAGRSPATATP
ncbi:MAG: hypothetical protein GY778_29020 [bacterium]|nr:hypothetical protein [bacterium]